jgi:segregation and condensation protein B
MARPIKKKTPPAAAPAAPPIDAPRVTRSEEITSSAAIDDSGLSLEEIGQAYAALLNRGDVPYEDPPAVATTAAENASQPWLAETPDVAEPPDPASDDCSLSPRSILEAMLFVGHPRNEPLTAREIAALMRGVQSSEIDELVEELNAEYVAADCPWHIAAEGAGYRFTLREEFADLRERFYGKAKEARLSQAAIDALAIIAYQQPVSVTAIDAMRGKPSGGIVSQLVRRGLVALERLPGPPKQVVYRTTDRFLELFALSSLDDLPRSHEEPE